jgi:hypothetical protein
VKIIIFYLIGKATFKKLGIDYLKYITFTMQTEIVAQLLKRAGKCTWRPERVVLATGSGGVVGGATVVLSRLRG